MLLVLAEGSTEVLRAALPHLDAAFENSIALFYAAGLRHDENVAVLLPHSDPNQAITSQIAPQIQNEHEKDTDLLAAIASLAPHLSDDTWSLIEARPWSIRLLPSHTPPGVSEFQSYLSRKELTQELFSGIHHLPRAIKM